MSLASASLPGNGSSWDSEGRGNSKWPGTSWACRWGGVSSHSYPLGARLLALWAEAPQPLEALLLSQIRQYGHTDGILPLHCRR